MWWTEFEVAQKNKREAEFWASPKVNERFGSQIYIFFDMGFDSCVAQFKDVGFPPTGEVPTFLNMLRTLNQVTKDHFFFCSLNTRSIFLTLKGQDTS